MHGRADSPVYATESCLEQSNKITVLPLPVSGELRKILFTRKIVTNAKKCIYL